MFYVFSYKPTADILEANAHPLKMDVAPGVIHQVDILFQDGCDHKEYVQIFLGSYQIWPTNRGEKFRGNATVVSFREFREIFEGQSILTAKIWTDLGADWKEVIIQIGMLPKGVIQPLSFDELLKAAAGI